MDAAAILQDYLDDVSLLVMAGDYPAYREVMCLPLHIISHDESKVVATEDDLRAGFEMFCQTLKMQKVTDFIRLVEATAELDPTLISGSYVTHLLSGGNRILPPFRNQITLRLEGNRWRAASITNPLANSRWPLVRLALHPDDDPKGPEE